MPTTFADSKVQISERVARSRREETYNAALEIHAWLILGVCLSLFHLMAKLQMSFCHFIAK